MSEYRKPDSKQLAWAALEELLRRADLHRTTGMGSIRVSFNQGSPTGAKIEIEENFNLPKT